MRRKQNLMEFSLADVAGGIGRGLRKAANWDPTRLSKDKKAQAVASGEAPAGPDQMSQRAFQDLIQAAQRTNLSPSMQQFAKELLTKSKGYKLPPFSLNKDATGAPKQAQAKNPSSTPPTADKKPLPARQLQPMEPATGLGPAGANKDFTSDVELGASGPAKGKFDTSDTHGVGNDDKTKSKKKPVADGIRRADRLLHEMFGTRKGD